MDTIVSINTSVDSRKGLLTSLSDSIWGYAESGFEEEKSSTALRKTLEDEEFTVETSLAGIDTAFMASWGSGEPTIAFLGEYDALPGLSQAAGIWEKKETVPHGNGHGCGHNLLGVGALAAALAARDFLSKTGTAGTIRYYGCPGEEFGCGKTFMAREGSFDGVDLALTWHPADVNCVLQITTLANLSIYFSFKGKSAHAAWMPHLGRSALDAVELMNVGANYLREHVIPEARIHYAITDSGGKAPNVVQDRAESHYYVRAPDVNTAKEIYERLVDVGRGAALMTGTELEVRFAQGLSDYLPNRTIGTLLQKSMESVGIPNFDSADRELAKRFHDTLSSAEIASAISQASYFQGVEAAKNLATSHLAEIVGPFAKNDLLLPGSTDVGDVSQLVPTGQIATACATFGTAPHTWQFTAQAGSSIGHKGMLAAGRALAIAAVEALKDRSLIDHAWIEFRQKSTGGYSCPIPDNIQPADVKRTAS